MRCQRAVMFVLMLLIGGCATIMHGSHQKVAIDSRPSGAKVFVDDTPMGTAPVECQLDRESNHTVRLVLDGYKTKEIELEKGIANWTWGNIVFGGFIGLGVDAMTGAIYKLKPEQVDEPLSSTKKTMIHIRMNPDQHGEKIAQLTPIDR